MMLAGLVILACALAAVAYLLIRRMGVDEEREKHETRVMRDISHRQAVPEFEHSSGARFEDSGPLLDARSGRPTTGWSGPPLSSSARKGDIDRPLDPA